MGNSILPKIPPQIKDAFLKGNLVVFIGAGISRIIGCPSWKDYAIKYLDYAMQKNCLNFYIHENLKVKYYNQPRKIITIVKKLLEEKEIEYPNITTLLKSNENKSKDLNIYNYLARLNVIFITTNWDDYLELALKRITEDLKEGDQEKINELTTKTVNSYYRREELLTKNLEVGSIMYLHGSIKDESTIIQTTYDYINHYEKKSEASILLEHIFNNYTVLFIGYGLDEYEILDNILKKSSKSKKETKHFMLFPIFSSEQEVKKVLERYYSELGVELLEYEIDQKGHKDLEKVIKEWSANIKYSADHIPFTTKKAIIDEVFQIDGS